MREILPNQLWIGAAADSRDVGGVMDREIQTVVNLALEEPPVIYPREILSFRIPLLDGGDNSAETLRLAIETVGCLISTGLRSLVSCSAGMSRSPLIVAAALPRLGQIPLESTVKQVVQNAPHDCSPMLWRDVQKALLS